jgi:hypothetical protein
MCLATTKLGEREVVAAIWWNWEIGARQALLELPNDHQAPDHESSDHLAEKAC